MMNNDIPVKADDGDPQSPAKTDDKSIVNHILSIVDQLPSIVVYSDVVKNVKAYATMLWLNFQENPSSILSLPLLSADVSKYILGICELGSIMAPKQAEHVFDTIRNLVLLDMITVKMSEKVVLPNSSATAESFAQMVKSYNLSISKASYTYVVRHDRVCAGGCLMGSCGMHAVGEVFEIASYSFVNGSVLPIKAVIKAKNFSSYFDEETGLYYANHTSQKLESDYYVHLELVDYKINVVLTMGALFNAQNGAELHGACRMWCAYYNFAKQLECDPESWGMSIFNPDSQCIDLLTIEPRTQYAPVESYFTFVSKKKVINKYTNYRINKDYQDILKRMVSAIELGVSRSYAFVGVPGTGKTIMMDQLALDLPDTTIVNVDMSSRIAVIRTLQDIMANTRSHNVVFLVDDFDKNPNLVNGKCDNDLIDMFDFMHSLANRIHKTFSFIFTINNPTILGNAIIKRSRRIDEVIVVDIPTVAMYRAAIDIDRDSKDHTNYNAAKFSLVFRYMRKCKVTLADLKNIYDYMIISHNTTKHSDTMTFGVFDMLRAIKMVSDNKTNASKNYTI